MTKIVSNIMDFKTDKNIKNIRSTNTSLVVHGPNDSFSLINLKLKNISKYNFNLQKQHYPPLYRYLQ